jgi:hypothetical protein
VKAHAFDLDTYTSTSKLASGHWVKIKVADSGMYLITPDQLRKWGFSDPSAVRVYGYGGKMQSDVLTTANYVDDLPLAGCEYTSRGLFFYAQGPISWSYDISKNYTASQNYYSNDAYYFLSDAPEIAELPNTGSAVRASNAATTFTEHLLHESEQVSPGSTGHILLGEDFRTKATQTFTFDLTDNASESIWVRTSFGANVQGGTGRIAYSINGESVTPSPATIEASANEEARHFILKAMTASYTAASPMASLNLGITFSSSATVKLARLDNIVINYTRALSFNADQLAFRAEKAFALAGASEGTRIWDITTTGKTKIVNFTIDNGSACSSPTESGTREYIAWNPDATFPTPVYVGETSNQDLHAISTPDMVIFTLHQWKSNAESLADLHRADPQNLSVLVLPAEQVYNEFSSGTPDIGAFRRCLKMLWDRGGGTSESDSKLRYVLMFGRSFYDHRGITTEGASAFSTILPQWQSLDGETDNQSYTTEDYLAFLRDKSGATPGSDYHCVGVGRIPLNTSTEAQTAVTKIQTYMRDANKGDWKNRYLLCADDGDSAEHLNQMERSDSLLMVSGRGADNIYQKVYIDAFTLTNGKATGAHERMNRFLDQGVIWWWFIGHASTTAWTGEGLLELSDINKASYPHAPMMFAATCNFLRWDRLQLSGAEMLFFNTNGIIGAIAATRPVYISNNKTMSYGLARTANLRDDNGNPLPIGEIFRRAKNTSLNNDTNKLRYVLMGDPALALAAPNRSIAADKFDDTPIDSENPPSIMAQQQLTLSGRILDNEGNTDTSFNGYVLPTIYDAEYSTITLAHDVSSNDGTVTEGVESIFDQTGERLFIGRADVTNGEFSAKVSMPLEISGNYRPATLNLYAVNNEGTLDAGSVNRNFYVYGYASNVDPDNTPPVIEFFGLNSEGFRSGQTVNSTPMVIAHVSDDIGINISSAGIGHQISLLLDGQRTFPDAVHYYTPGADGASSGSLYFTLDELASGTHTLRLRVWDTSNNMAEEQIEFNVDPDQAPEIFDLYADCNPAVESTNFIVSHNRPDAVLDVKVEVFDLMGRCIWTGEQSARSDLGLSEPLTWNLTDKAGRRVNRGIYLYRASITTDNANYVSASRKLAVKAQ